MLTPSQLQPSRCTTPEGRNARVPVTRPVFKEHGGAGRHSQPCPRREKNEAQSRDISLIPYLSSYANLNDFINRIDIFKCIFRLSLSPRINKECVKAHCYVSLSKVS